MGFAPYERRALELLRVSKGKFRLAKFMSWNISTETDISVQISDAFVSWRSASEPTPAPRQSVRRCLALFSNNVRLLPPSTKLPAIDLLIELKEQRAKKLMFRFYCRSKWIISKSVDEAGSAGVCHFMIEKEKCWFFCSADLRLC